MSLRHGACRKALSPTAVWNGGSRAGVTFAASWRRAVPSSADLLAAVSPFSIEPQRVRRADQQQGGSTVARGSIQVRRGPVLATNPYHPQCWGSGTAKVRGRVELDWRRRVCATAMHGFHHHTERASHGHRHRLPPFRPPRHARAAPPLVRTQGPTSRGDAPECGPRWTSSAVSRIS